MLSISESDRNKILDEFTFTETYGGFTFRRVDRYALADEIVRLRAALAAAPKVTVLLDEFAIVNKNSWIVARGPFGAMNDYRVEYDNARPNEAPHTMRRVALLDEPTTGGVSGE